MSYDLAINQGQVLITQNEKISSANVHLGIKDGKIVEISRHPLQAKQVIDARYLHVLPGVIDSQVHFREPGLTHKEDLESGTRAAVLGGVTSVFEMPNTNPPTTSEQAFNEKIRLASEKAWTNYAFYVGAAAENISELAKLEALPGCAGVKVFMGSSTGNLLIEDDETLRKIFLNTRRRVVIHSEDEYRLRERKHIAIDSKDVRNHHLWRDTETALRSTQRLLKIARELNRKVHVLHITTKEEVELLKQNKDIASFEITPNHLTLHAPECYEQLGTRAQMNPPIREKEHQVALWQAIQDGSADVIGTDHAPHTLAEKAKEYPSSPSGMPGVQTVVPLMLNHIHQGKLSLLRFVELMCENPRKIFGCRSKGRIDIGLDADLTLVDLKQQERISDEMIVSKCGWTPFHGMMVTGWPRMTLINGQIVMADGKLQAKPGCGKKIFFE